jgi:hypothetical protein
MAGPRIAHRRSNLPVLVVGGIGLLVLGASLLGDTRLAVLRPDPTVTPRATAVTIPPTPSHSPSLTPLPSRTAVPTPASTRPGGSATPIATPTELPSTAAPLPYDITETVRAEVSVTLDAEGNRWLISQAWIVSEAAADRSESALTGIPTAARSSVPRWENLQLTVTEAGYAWELRDGGLRITPRRGREQPSKEVGALDTVDDSLVLPALQIGTVRLIPDESGSFICLKAPAGAIAQPTPEPRTPSCAGDMARLPLRADAAGSIVLPVRVNGTFWRNALLIQASEGFKVVLGAVGALAVATVADGTRRLLTRLLSGPAAAFIRRFRKPKRGTMTKRRRR